MKLGFLVGDSVSLTVLKLAALYLVPQNFEWDPKYITTAISLLGEVPDIKKKRRKMHLLHLLKNHLILRECSQLPFKVPGQEGVSEVTRTVSNQIPCPSLPVQHLPAFINAREQLKVAAICSRPVSFKANESIWKFIIVLVATRNHSKKNKNNHLKDLYHFGWIWKTQGQKSNGNDSPAVPS